MGRYFPVAKTHEIPEGTGQSFVVDGAMVAVFHVGGEFTAIDDTCPHMGASLAAGHIEGEGVMCPWHAWRFSIKDGRWLDNPKSKIGNACYPVRVIGDSVEVMMPDGDQADTAGVP